MKRALTTQFQMERKYIAYYRLSKDTNARAKNKSKRGILGIEVQKQIVHNYYHDDIIEEHEEVKSGERLDTRPVLQSLISKIKSHNQKASRDFDLYLLVCKADRLSRKTSDALNILEQLDNRLVCCDIPTNGNEIDSFVMTLVFAMAQRERELASIRIRNTLSHLKSKGVKLGKPENFSDEQRKANAHAQHESALKDGNTQRAVAFIHELRSSGKTWEVIADELNANQYMTRNKNRWTAANAHRVYTRAQES